MSLPNTVDGVISRLRDIDSGLPAKDGVAVFNRMYLTVTERVAAVIADPASAGTRFRDAETMAALDVGFANHWLAAIDDAAAGRRVTPAWRPLFEARDARRLSVQYAIAGMNTHIEHDLPIAVVDTCRTGGLEPDDVHADYETVNEILAQVESSIRRSFLDASGRAVDDRVGPIVHLLSTWKIDKARDLAWVTAETIWALRRTRILRGRFLDGLGHTVGMTSRALLIPAG
ncbi:DUF5995 family protein [Mumia qirimensis]|uniref:DUF5995 family protein n=1 Tax=Mumia qirimensis TaxID=3234852 RepID=UPI00351D4A9C